MRMNFRKIDPCEDCRRNCEEPCWKVEHGLLVEIPCKIGDIVWVIRNYKGYKHPQKGIVKEMYFLKDMTLQIAVSHIARGEFGKTIFLTEAEALNAIKGERKNDE